MEKFLKVCRVVYKLLGYVLAACGGASAAILTNGCAFVPVL